MKQDTLVQAIIQSALAAVDPAAAMRRALQLDGETLCAGDRNYRLAEYAQIYVIGAGKASGAMAAALEVLLGDRLTAGLVAVKYGYTAPTTRVKLLEAGHPVLDAAGLAATREIMALAGRATAGDLVIALISGGGSALLEAPLDGVSLADLQATTEALLACGATINELNAVRKQLSQVKGGKLAQLVAPAALLTLVVSDVVGSPLEVIASGPTVPDGSTPADALAVLGRYELRGRVPGSVLRTLEALDASPAGGPAPRFDHAQTLVIASNEQAALAAERKAQKLGLNTLLLSTYLEGEAREVARVMAGIAKEIRHHNRPVAAPACVIAGGETTVTLRGTGRGGRNQELALAAALALDGLEGVAVVCLATDGSDGPTDAAGACATGDTIARGRALGLAAADYLANNDSYAFFAQLGDLIVTGPTNTNVNDLILIIVR